MSARLLAATRPFRAVLVLLVALFAFLALTQDGFFTTENLEALLTAVAALWIVSMGMTFVLLTGGVDLAAPAIVALVGVCAAKLLGAGVPSGVAVALALAFGAALGAAFNGVLIGVRRLSFFVVTLGTLTALSGVVALWTNAQSIIVGDALVRSIGVGTLLGLPAPIWIMAGVFLAALLVQRATFFGRDVYAVGGSLTAARLSGIRTSRTLVVVYGLSGLCAALAALILVGRIGSASPQVDATLALQAAAAVLLGGTRLTGGYGGVGGTALGVLFIGVLQNGLSIAGVASFWQMVVTGVILVMAVIGTDEQGAS